MTSQVSPVIFPVKWTKIVDFARNSVFWGGKWLKTFLKILLQHFIITYFKKEVSCVHT